MNIHREISVSNQSGSLINVGEGRVLKLSIKEEPEGSATESIHQPSIQVARSSLQQVSSIPPERVGIHGEYDHSGLAKRVMLALQQRFGEEISNLFLVSQRGRVVILEGPLNDRAFVNQMVQVALSVEGAAFVETYDLWIQEYA